MDTTDFQNRIEHQFDGYCRKVLKNSLRTLLAERRRRSSREIPLEPTDIDSLYSASDAPETRLIHSHQLDQWTSALLDDLIAEAIRSLDDEQRTIVLRYYFLGRSDYQDRRRNGYGSTHGIAQKNESALRLERLSEQGGER